MNQQRDRAAFAGMAVTYDLLPVTGTLTPADRRKLVMYDDDLYRLDALLEDYLARAMQAWPTLCAFRPQVPPFVPYDELRPYTATAVLVRYVSCPLYVLRQQQVAEQGFRLTRSCNPAGILGFRLEPVWVG